MGYTARDVKKVNDVTNTLVYGESLTKKAITPVFHLSCFTANNFKAAIKASAATVAVGITVYLQTRLAGASSWVDAKSVAITNTSEVNIKLLSTDSGDWTYLPLGTQGRLAITTGTGDSATIEYAIVTFDE